MTEHLDPGNINGNTVLKDASVSEAKLAIYNAPTGGNILGYHITDGMKWGSINDYITTINHSKIDLTALPNKYLTNTGYVITS